MFLNNPQPPIASKIPINKKAHGIARIDYYHWFRDPNWQEVVKGQRKLDSNIRKHLEAENSYTKAMMEDTTKLQQILFGEMRSRIKEKDSTIPEPDGNFAYYEKYEEGDQYPRLMRSTRDGFEETCLLDVNKLAENRDYFDFDGAGHSPNHNYLSWSFDNIGSEVYTLKVQDLTTNQIIYTIENTTGEAVFSADESCFFYCTVNDDLRSNKVFRRMLDGSSSPIDSLIYEEKDPAFSVSAGGTKSKKYIIFETEANNSNELRLIKADSPLSEPILFRKREGDVRYCIYDQEDRFLILTNIDGAKDFKIMSAPIENFGRKNWKELVPHTLGKPIENMGVLKNWFIRKERVNGLEQIVIQSRNNDNEKFVIEFEEEAYDLCADLGIEYDKSNFKYVYSSLTTPDQIFDFEIDTGERTLLKTIEIPSGHNVNDYVTRRIMVKGKEGVEIPITLLHHKSTKLDGSPPCLQYGYGAYGDIMDTEFDSNILSLVDRGMVYVIAHVRGGEEKGFDWYDYGRLKHKWNTFNDFIRVTQYLVEENLVDRSRIVAHGDSAGGLLMGVIANTVPELYKGIVAGVPFVDVLNTMLDDSLTLTPREYDEWGNPSVDKEAYRLIESYSPYDNVKPVKYPSMLVTAGMSDSRVNYWESAKWVAKLRENCSENPILLKIDMDSGHSGATGRFDSLREEAFIYAFILKVCGLT